MNNSIILNQQIKLTNCEAGYSVTRKKRWKFKKIQIKIQALRLSLTENLEAGRAKPNGRRSFLPASKLSRKARQHNSKDANRFETHATQ